MIISLTTVTIFLFKAVAIVFSLFLIVILIGIVRSVFTSHERWSDGGNIVHIFLSISFFIFVSVAVFTDSIKFVL